MGKLLVGNNPGGVGDYTFNAGSSQITFTGLSGLVLEQLLIITNVTDNIIIYNFADASKGGTLAGSVLTLDFSTVGMDNTDDLQIFIDWKCNPKDMVITDPITGDQANVTPSGELKVVTPPPEAPAGTDPVYDIAYTDMNGTEDSLYTITSGKALNIQRVIGSSQQAVSGNVTELWSDPNGNLVGMQIIAVIHSDGSQGYLDLNTSISGDGTHRILLRRKRLSGGTAWIYGAWQGYEE